MRRNDRIYEEAAALWRHLHDEPPPREADGATILELILKTAPTANYARLATPNLRSNAITFPKPADS